MVFMRNRDFGRDHIYPNLTHFQMREREREREFHRSRTRAHRASGQVVGLGLREVVPHLRTWYAQNTAVLQK